MSSQRRAFGLGLVGILCAVAATSTAQSQANRYRDSFGPLRSVVVVRKDLRSGRPLDGQDVSRMLSVRRVPSSFVPPGTMRDPAGAIGLESLRRVRAGTYLQLDRLRPPAPRRSGPRTTAGRIPVELAIKGAGALAELPGEVPVDVLVVTERGDGSVGTRVAERRASLIELSPPGADETASEGAGAGLWTATLSVRRRHAPKLIEAHANARETRLLASGPDGR